MKLLMVFLERDERKLGIRKNEKEHVFVYIYSCLGRAGGRGCKLFFLLEQISKNDNHFH